jgi:hypothetical protein
MSPTYREGDKKVWIRSWESHVDKMIREAQERGEFDNLPGAGKPLQLEDNVYAAEWQSAYRMAKNAGAAPLWVELEKEIAADTAALQAMLDRTAGRLQAEAARLQEQERAAQQGKAARGLGAEGAETVQMGAGTFAGPAEPRRGLGRWLPLSRRRPPKPPEAEPPRGPASLVELEAERQRVRALYLAQSAALDKKIQDYNANRPRTLSWLEKPRLLPAAAARRFDAACPAFS